MAYIWQISIVRFSDLSIVSGVILDGKSNDLHTQSAKNYRIVLGSYFKKPFANKKIKVAIGSKIFNTTTDDHGGFMVETGQDLTAEIKVFVNGKSEPLKTTQNYPVVFKNSDQPICVISDVDDTILVSYTASFRKRVGTLLFTSPQKRKSISFTKEILDAISQGDGRVFYVSKSENNLFGILTSFIQNHRLPEGNLSLTPYLKFNQLLNTKKGKDYKEKTIRKIIERSPEKKFILIGDDTQQDMAVYEKTARMYPNQVVKIYIRKTMKNLLGHKKEQMNKMGELAVPFLYFSDEDDVHKEIQLIKNIQI